MLTNQNLIRNELRTILVSSFRSIYKNKNPIEKIPKDPPKLKSNQPPMLDSAIYSEEEKLNLWKNYSHFELSPTYVAYTKEEQEKMIKGHLENLQIVGVTKSNENKMKLEIDPAEAPYNEIYEDGIDEGNFTKAISLTEKEPQRWYWVERLMPKMTVNRSDFELDKEYPSGIKVPSKQPDLPYFVCRTRNQLLPVYKKLERDDERPKTQVRKIEGKIWDLEHELRTRLESKYKKRILTAVDEVNGELIFVGNYVFDLVEHLEELGF